MKPLYDKPTIRQTPDGAIEVYQRDYPIGAVVTDPPAATLRVYRSSPDRTLCVEVGTGDDPGHLRVDVDDKTVYDVDPGGAEDPGHTGIWRYTTTIEDEREHGLMPSISGDTDGGEQFDLYVTEDEIGNVNVTFHSTVQVEVRQNTSPERGTMEPYYSREQVHSAAEKAAAMVEDGCVLASEAAELFVKVVLALLDNPDATLDDARAGED